MRQQDTRRISRFLTASLLGTALLCAPRIGAAEQTQVAIASPSEDELLMFWEEKELYVQTATRSEKPLTQVAENMTVISAKEIEAMNATSVNDVLARVPGVFVDVSTNDFNSPALLHIQGSEDRHVTVLLDGMPVNFLADGHADTTFIPLRIVERIEIIKGAASSAWGSALGGVINIITRTTGDTPLPNGMLSGSFGEGDSGDLAADLSGKYGPLGYYLYAGQQVSDGLRNNRDFRRTSVFGKLHFTPNRDLDITLSAGYSNPKMDSGDLPPLGIRSKVMLRNRFVNGAFEFRATPELVLRGGLHLFQSYTDSPSHFLDDGSLFKQNIFDEQTIGGNLRATWSSGFQTLTLGMEASHGAMDETTNAGPLYQSFGVPATFTVSPTVDRWGIFANDTIEIGPLAITPGIRLDHDSISGYFISPSLGLTWELGEHSLLRASAARGFTSPPIGFSSGQGLFALPNRKLIAEYGWSYQIGVESGLANVANMKATLFRHETTKAMSPEAITGNFPYKQMINGGDVTRQGYELEAESVPFHNLSLKLGHAYAHANADDIPSDRVNKYWDTYSWLVGIKYDDRRSFTALLSGSYVWWDYAPTEPNYPNPFYGTFIWDLTATKKFKTSDKTTLETFLTIHNLFSGAHYTSSLYLNPGRWVEGGLRFRF
ncbi:MAG: TonB-dependent receptor [Desulfuromonadales bacterium]|nr:TonB-dependent receptor [Desulfuromonadales bacterium]